jgi:hypothetical protein
MLSSWLGDQRGRLDFEQNGSAQLPSSTLPSPTLAVFAPHKLLNLRLPGVLRE